MVFRCHQTLLQWSALKHWGIHLVLLLMQNRLAILSVSTTRIIICRGKYFCCTAVLCWSFLEASRSKRLVCSSQTFHQSCTWKSVQKVGDRLKSPLWRNGCKIWIWHQTINFFTWMMSVANFCRNKRCILMGDLANFFWVLSEVALEVTHNEDSFCSRVRPIPGIGRYLLVLVGIGTYVSIGADTSSSFTCLNSHTHAYIFKPIVCLILRNRFLQHCRQQQLGRSSQR